MLLRLPIAWWLLKRRRGTGDEVGEEVGLAVVELSGVGVVDGMERVTERDGEDGPPPGLIVFEDGGCGWGGIMVDVVVVVVVEVDILVLRSDGDDDDEGKEVWRWRGVGWLGRILVDCLKMRRIDQIGTEDVWGVGRKRQ